MDYQATVARILQVCNTDFYLHRFLAPLVRALVDAGHEVDCVCEGQRLPAGILGPGVNVLDVAFPRRARPLAFLKTIRALRPILRAGRYDLVNSHNRNASVAARIASWLERVPHNVYTAHGYYFHDNQSGAAFEATLKLEALLARLTDHTLSQSQEDTDLVLGRGMLAPAEITTIGNGIDTAKFAPRQDRSGLEAELELGQSSFRIGAVGRIVAGKGFDDLVAAFARLGAADPALDAQLVVVGGNIAQDISPFAEQFRRRVDELGVADRVVLTGITDHVERYLATCDVFVLPSYREGMPRALLEAMCLGLPVVASDIRGCREIVLDGVTGYLYPVRDVDALMERLRRVREASPAQRRTLGRAAHERVMERFTEAGYIARQVTALEAVLRR